MNVQLSLIKDATNNVIGLRMETDTPREWKDYTFCQTFEEHFKKKLSTITVDGNERALYLHHQNETLALNLSTQQECSQLSHLLNVPDQLIFGNKTTTKFSACFMYRP